MADSNISAARLPISTNGCWMVVSGGRICPADSMSSKPITDTSSGTRSPASAAAVITAYAVTSECAKTAVGR